jgi:hypothetical protein
MYMYVHVYVCMHRYVCVYVCMCVYMCVYVCGGERRGLGDSGFVWKSKRA